MAGEMAKPASDLDTGLVLNSHHTPRDAITGNACPSLFVMALPGRRAEQAAFQLNAADHVASLPNQTSRVPPV